MTEAKVVFDIAFAIVVVLLLVVVVVAVEASLSVAVGRNLNHSAPIGPVVNVLLSPLLAWSFQVQGDPFHRIFWDAPPLSNSGK